MDTFYENEFPSGEPENRPEADSASVSSGEDRPQQSQPQQPQEYTGDTGYRGAGAGRRESPYADSPYATGSTPRQDPHYYQYHYQPQAAKKPKVKKSHRGVWKSVLAGVLAVALVASGCLITASVVDSRWEKRNSAAMDQLNQKISQLEEQIGSSGSQSSGGAAVGTPTVSGSQMTPGQVYAQNVSAVVTVSSTITTRMYGQTSQGTSTGSGFLISSDGYVVTNNHVIDGASSITVTTSTGEEYDAVVQGKDATNDVAVLKIEGENLPCVTLGSSDSLSIGDMVVAIGNPLGTLSATQTVGYVSGKNREVTTDNSVINMIQTDAVINPGNSGGPLFNMYGEVVGITTAKYSGTTSSGASIEGIGFAIPIDDVMGIIGDLRDLGYVTGAYLGITVMDTDKESVTMYGLPTGALVRDVVEGGSADRAGVKAKDIIIGLGDYTISSMNELTRTLRKFKAGDTTTITVVRGGQEVTLSITLDERPKDLDTGSSTENDPSMPSEGDYNEWYDYFRRFFGGNG